jgi:hypothetical protein
MKVSYKWPITSNALPSEQQALFVSKTNNNQVSTSANPVGIATVVCYFITLLYIYGSSWAKMHKDIFPNVFKRFIKEGEQITEPIYIHTLSDSFQHCEKRVTTILVLLLLALLTGLYTSQNLSDTNSPMRNAVIAMNYLIFLTWFLFFFIWPAEKAHMPIAFITLMAVILNASFVMILYEEYFSGDVINSVRDITYVIIAFALFAMLVMAISSFINEGFGNIVQKFKGTNFGEKFAKFKLGTQFIAICEILCLISFGIFMVYIIQLPPLPPVGSLSCSMAPPPASPASS